MKLGAQAAGAQAKDQAADDLALLASRQLAMAVAVAMVKRGFAVRALPGSPVVLEKGALRLDPFTALDRVASGEGEPALAAWRSLVREAGVGGDALGA